MLRHRPQHHLPEDDTISGHLYAGPPPIVSITCHAENVIYMVSSVNDVEVRAELGRQMTILAGHTRIIEAYILLPPGQRHALKP